MKIELSEEEAVKLGAFAARYGMFAGGDVQKDAVALSNQIIGQVLVKEEAQLSEVMEKYGFNLGGPVPEVSLDG